MELRNKTVVVVGLARTGEATVKFLLREGAEVIVSELEDSVIKRETAERLNPLGVNVELGRNSTETLLKGDLIVLSPGVPLGNKAVRRAIEEGNEVISEIELAYHFLPFPIIAVTGTNGKSTTTALIGEILKAWGKRVFVGGNIGAPLIKAAGGDYEIAVVEVSSFQLEGTREFHPHIAVFLNLSPDHLDRYSDREEYYHAKARIFKRMTGKDYLVLNADDDEVMSLAKGKGVSRYYFSSRKDVIPGAVLEGKMVWWRNGLSKQGLDLKGARLKGVHNMENILASICCLKILKCPETTIENTLKVFHGLPHRMEDVGEVAGVRYINDSKGTNVGAMKKSILSFEDGVILIAGGRDKGGDFHSLRGLIEGRVKKLILLGEAAKRIDAALGDIVEGIFVKEMKDAVNMARQTAGPGDVVLLSPGCASFDMFGDFEERGDVFKDEVERLKLSR